MKHKLPVEFLKTRNVIMVIGAGGNGAQFLNGLARMQLSLAALGHPGFEVTVHDGDVVTEANIGRQLFSASDIGTAKSSALVNRINAYYGLNWTAFPVNWPRNVEWRDYNSEVAIAVGCVDNNAARRQIADYHRRGLFRYWLDMGNEATNGQVIMGESAAVYQLRKRNEDNPSPRLPTVADLFREVMDSDRDENNAPSCSLAGALERQDLFINQFIATAALNLLWCFYRKGGLDYSGVFINSATGQVNPLPIDEDAWKRIGLLSKNKAPLRKIRKILQKPGPFRPGRYKLECGHIHEGTGRFRVRCTKCAANLPRK
jgi:PRTRC genetic system ThiF family protein